MKEMIVLDTAMLALNERTAEGYILGTKAAKRLVEDFNNHLEERGVVTLEPSSINPSTEDICGKVRKPGLVIRDGKIYAEIELLDTPKGKIVKAIVESGMPIYGDIAIEAFWPAKGGSPRGVDYKSFHYCVLTGNPGITSKKECSAKMYRIPVLEKDENVEKKTVKCYPVGSVVEVTGNCPEKGKIGEVILCDACAGLYSYEIVDEKGTNFFVTGSENLTKYEGFFERKDKLGTNPLAEPEKLDVVKEITKKVNETRSYDELPAAVREEIVGPERKIEERSEIPVEIQQEILPPQEEQGSHENPIDVGQAIARYNEKAEDQKEQIEPIIGEAIKEEVVVRSPVYGDVVYPKGWQPRLETPFDTTHKIFKEKIKNNEANKLPERISEMNSEQKELSFKTKKEIYDSRLKAGDEVFIVSEGSRRFIGRKAVLIGYQELFDYTQMEKVWVPCVVPEFESTPIYATEITSYKNRQIGDVAFDNFEMTECNDQIIKNGDAVLIYTNSFSSEYNNMVCTFVKEVIPDEFGQVDLDDYSNYIDLANSNERAFLVRLAEGGHDGYEYAIVPCISRVEREEDVLNVGEFLRGDEVTAHICIGNKRDNTRAILIGYAKINGVRNGFVLRTKDEKPQNFWAAFVD